MAIGRQDIEKIGKTTATEVIRKAANCRRAAEHLAEAWMTCDRIKMDVISETKAVLATRFDIEVANLEGNLRDFYHEIGRREFEGHAHDLANLKREAEFAKTHNVPRSDFIYRYAEDLQKQMINQGFLDIIDCQCKPA